MSLPVEKVLRKAQSLMKAGELAEAEELYKQVLSKFPKNKKAIQGYQKLKAGITSKGASSSVPPQGQVDELVGLYNQRQFEEVLAKIKPLVSLFPKAITLHNIQGASNAALQRYDAAIDSYKQAIKIKPDYAEAYYNLSFPDLLQGSLEEGFKLYEWRSRKKKRIVAPARANFIWDGKQSLNSKRFVAYEEQGLGDTIQFCRYLPLLEQKGADVTFKVKPVLHTLLQTMSSNASFSTSHPEEPEIDFETPLMSLPNLLNTSLETIPATNPYLYADHDRSKAWGERFSKDRFKIGICWQGSKTKVDFGRSFPLSLFEGISKTPNVELISLHKGEGEDQIANIDFDVTTLGPDFDAGPDAFVDTAAVMMNCDLIITSDTAVAHLAGALGCQTWVALKHIPDWRWMLNRSDCPWYPTMTLYRQKNRGDWADVFYAIKHDLSLLIDQKGQ